MTGVQTCALPIYAVDPTVLAKAVDLLGSEDLADHIDLNFGCPVPKVTRRGGGAALPYKRKLFSAIVESSIKAASKYGLPVARRARRSSITSPMRCVTSPPVMRKATSST